MRRFNYRAIEHIAHNSNFWIVEGFLDGVPELRGEDDVVPYVAGRLKQARIEDHHIIIAEGFIDGKGVTIADQQANYWVRAAQLAALWAAAMKDTDPSPLIVQTQSLPAAYTTNARLTNVAPQPLKAGLHRSFLLEFEVIDVFPVWTVVP
jgi:hypothetical protein